MRRPLLSVFYRLLVMTFVCVAPVASAQVADTNPPNIVLIMVDDIGAEAVGVYGSTSYQTPRLDALAAEGIRFENCYASPACTPSRVQIMTGLYPHTSGWAGFINLKPNAKNDDYVHPTFGTFAQTLREQGYATAIGGKWQLSRFDKRPEHIEQMGFDEHCMWTWIYNDKYQSRYWGPSLFRNGEFVKPGRRKYGPDKIHDFLLDFIERKKDGPFFVYYPMLLVHTEFHPTSDFDGDVQAELKSIKDENKAGKAADKKYKNLGKSRAGADRYFADMVVSADKKIGLLVDKLDELGIRENTVILMTGDNGTPHQVLSTYRDEKGELEIEGGKLQLTETGTRVPLIVSWKGKSPEGLVANDLIDFADFHPTFAELAGAPLATGSVDGQSFAARIAGEANPPLREWALAGYYENRFVRDDRFKLYNDGRFLDMSDRYRAVEVEPSSSPEAQASHDTLKAVLDSLPENADRYRYHTDQ